MQEGVVLGTMVVPHARGVLGIMCPPTLGDNSQQSCNGSTGHGYGARVMTKEMIIFDEDETVEEDAGV